MGQLLLQMVRMAFHEKLVFGFDVIRKFRVEYFGKAVEDEIWLFLLFKHNCVCWCWIEYFLTDHVGCVGEKGDHWKNDQDNPALSNRKYCEVNSVNLRLEKLSDRSCISADDANVIENKTAYVC